MLATLDGGSIRCHHRLRERQEVPRAAISADGDAVGNTPTLAVYIPSNTQLHRTFVSHVLWKHELPCITNPLLTFAANHLLNYLLIGYTYHPLLQGRSLPTVRMCIFVSLPRGRNALSPGKSNAIGLSLPHVLGPGYWRSPSERGIETRLTSFERRRPT